MLTLGTILEALSGRKIEGGTQVITDACLDSRLAIPGSLFVAIPGERVDGHDFVANAFKNRVRLLRL
jgi:UDP-N-acetylmuramoyl-tripeptide--D-alanyl-D-alanine ligase